jgi:hypothetical protein
MQPHPAAAHARPTADWIRHYAADLLAAVPGMHQLDAVRQAIEAKAGEVGEPPVRAPSSGAAHPPTGGGQVS